MSSLLRNIITLIIILLVGVGAYMIVVQEPAGSGDLVTVDTNPLLEGENAAFLRHLQEVREIEMDTSIFSDPRFLSLRNFRLELVDEPTGRDNPFRPIGQ